MRHEHKLEIYVQIQGYDPVGITKTCAMDPLTGCNGEIQAL